VRRFASVVRSVSPRRAAVGVLATFAATALLTCGVAAADSVSTNFEPPFTTGSVNLQFGWKSATPFNIPSLTHGYDQAVVANAAIPTAAAGQPPPGPTSFGTQSLRISNGWAPTDPNSAPPEFHYQTYSTPNADPAGQDLTNTVFIGQFSFISVFPFYQPGLRISVSPDNGEGGRMSYIGLDDMPDGVHVVFYDTTPEGDYTEYDLAGAGTGIVLGNPPLSRNQVHTIRFWIKFNPGPNNDLVRISVDGQDSGQCFTTWESTYNPVPITDRLLFLVGNRNGDIPTLLGGGYLFDDVTTTTSDVGGPPGCDETIDKTADSQTVTAGGVAGYQITTHNRGRTSARNLLLCDRIPRQTAFAGANRKLRRIGRRRCLMIQRLGPGQRTGFHIDLRVGANAPPGPLSNIADLIPGESPGQGSLADVQLPDLPANVAAAIAAAPPIAKVKVLVKILRARRTAPAPAPPPVTG
jgi:uncharacterized repeat protein (TIGR01451 family)